MGRWPCCESHFASLPVVVVFPEPCKPTIIHTEGGREAKSGLACLPSSAVSSSRTTLRTCWSGESCSITSLPIAFLRILASSSSATPTLTSPSSSASRISPSAASRCSSVSLPCPRRFLNARCNFSVRFSNMVPAHSLATLLARIAVHCARVHDPGSRQIHTRRPTVVEWICYGEGAPGRTIVIGRYGRGTLAGRGAGHCRRSVAGIFSG